jgi:hypothetical protein
MSHSIYDNTMNTVTVIGQTPTPSHTVTTGTNTISNSAGLYWGMNGTSGGSGQVLTSNGISPGWGNITLAEPALNGATLKVNGNADFEGEVTIKGKSLSEMFDKIEERLAILHPNPELEDRWDELKELGKRYKELEAELIEKEKVWAILKK